MARVSDPSIAYGPVPSRRLGRSLGINNIPPKICSYGCVYCQVGRTMEMRTGRRRFYAPGESVQEVEIRLEEVMRRGEYIDYLSFVPEGEPTLDLNLGKEIERLKIFGLPVAVITNSSLLDQLETREVLIRSHDILSRNTRNVEYLIGYEGGEFSAAGSPRQNLLGITAVHPMREDAVRELVRRAGAPWSLVEELVSDGSLCVTNYGARRYYVRRPRSR